MDLRVKKAQVPQVVAIDSLSVLAIQRVAELWKQVRRQRMRQRKETDSMETWTEKKQEEPMSDVVALVVTEWSGSS